MFVSAPTPVERGKPIEFDAHVDPTFGDYVMSSAGQIIGAFFTRWAIDQARLIQRIRGLRLGRMVA